MKTILLLIFSIAAIAQPPASSITINSSNVSGGTVNTCLYITTAHKVGSIVCSGASSGTVTSVGLTRTNDTNINATITGSPIVTTGTFNIALSWAGTLAAARMVNAGVHTGDAVGTFPAITLNTVNSNVGTFGDGTHVGQFTVNAKGLITAASSVSITGGGSTGCSPSSGTTNAVLVYDGATGCTTSSVTIDPTVGVAGGIMMPQGTAKTPSANTIVIEAPTAVTAYRHDLPGVSATGIPHYTNSSNVLTESISAIVASDITSATITGTQIASSIALAGSPTTTTQSADDNSTKIATTAYVDRMKSRALSFSIGDPTNSSALTTSSVSQTLTVPFACTISAYNLAFSPGDTGTITVKFWKVATGTAIPTISNVINTSGVGIASGTAIHSTTVSDFTTTAVAANDMIAMVVTAVATTKSITGVLQCDL